MKLPTNTPMETPRKEYPFVQEVVNDNESSSVMKPKGEDPDWK